MIKVSFCPKLAPEISLSSTDELVTSGSALAGRSLGWRKKVNSALQPRAYRRMLRCLEVTAASVIRVCCGGS